MTGKTTTESPRGSTTDSNKESSDEIQREVAWGVPTGHESHWYPAVAVLGALVLWIVLPAEYKIGALSWIVPVLEMALLIPLIITRRMPELRGTSLSRVLALSLIALINVTNLISLVHLVTLILSHHPITNTQALLFSAGDIWLTNVIVFGLWFWELDRGGPIVRRTQHHRKPDFLFPQMATPFCAPTDWAPDFVDYFYVSFTNATAFSPTDTMPLTNWAKMLMAAQSLISLITIGLVAARAVNILH